MNSHLVQGIIKHIDDKKYITQTFIVQEFILTTDFNTPYPQHVKFQCVNDNCFQLGNLLIGDTVNVKFMLRGKDGARPTNGGNHLPFTHLQAFYVRNDNAE